MHRNYIKPNPGIKPEMTNLIREAPMLIRRGIVRGLITPAKPEAPFEPPHTKKPRPEPAPEKLAAWREKRNAKRREWRKAMREAGLNNEGKPYKKSWSNGAYTYSRNHA